MCQKKQEQQNFAETIRNGLAIPNFTDPDKLLLATQSPEEYEELRKSIQAGRTEQLHRDEVQEGIFKELQYTRRQNWAIIAGTVIIIILTAGGLAVALHWL
jgi:GTP-dependent phosphoenolpyruvate carboxykinase